MREWMRQARIACGKTQLQVAREIGMSEGYYSYIESGNRQKKMDLSMMMKLARALNVSTDQIIENEKESA